MAGRGRLASAGIAFAAVALTSVFFIDLCNLIYQCGCTHLWAGADAHCNIHMPGAKHCPWCAVGPWGGLAVFAGIVIPQVVLSFHPARWNWKARLAAAVAAFPLIGGIEGLAMGLAMGYWN
jgi:hypothetical protein